MAGHPFLSPAWIEAALVIRDRHANGTQAALPAVRINLVVSDVPFGDGSITASIDTSAGSAIPRLGLSDQADATITLDYRTAHGLLVGDNPKAAVLAFMKGDIRVDGDLTKALALQQLSALDAHAEVLAITAPLD